MRQKVVLSEFFFPKTVKKLFGARNGMKNNQRNFFSAKNTSENLLAEKHRMKKKN